MEILNNFIKPSINKSLTFTPKGLKSFLNLIQIENRYRKQIKTILRETKRLPAALGGYHGDYSGGLYDHILLVTNCAYQICNNTKFLNIYEKFLRNQKVKVSKHYEDLDLTKVIQTSLYHDFGKIPYYAYKKELPNRTIFTTRKLIEIVSSEIKRKYNLNGEDLHVEGALAVIKKHELPYDDEISLGIIFHHGGWSRYKPIRSNKLSEVIHIADMIASHYYKI